jgi:hypothetical protein
VQSLAPARRLPWFERLAGAAAMLSPEGRAAVMRAAREVVAADGRVGLGEYLRICVLQRVLQTVDAASATQPAALSLDQLGNTIASVTADLATLLPPADRPAWVHAVLRGLGVPAPLDAATTRDLNGALERLALLARLQRPLLVKQWVAAADGRLPFALAEALRCVCLLIDTPLPPELAARFDDVTAAADVHPA